MPYIGKAPSSGIRSRFIYTATAAQTTFTGADGNGKTLGYTDGEYVDVYLNGVLLDPADYTATSKTSIVLDSGATVSDIVEIVVYDTFSVFNGTFTGDLTVDGDTLFVDASENKVGIGTTTVTDAGVTMTPSVTRSGGWDAKLALQSTAVNDFPALLFSNAATNRYGGIVSTNDASGNTSTNVTAQIDFFMSSPTDGNIRVKTNTDVGSSAPVTQWQFTHDGNLKAEVNGNGIDFSASAGSGASSSVLDDYEEGTWTPVVAQGWTSVSYTNSYQNGRYTKVGNMVTAWFWMQFSGTSAGNQIRVSGLPFTVPNVTAGAYRGGAVTFFSVPTDAAGAITPYVAQNQDQIQFFAMDDGGASALSNGDASSDFLIGSVTYWV